MRKTLKFLHTMGGIGLLGAMVVLVICHSHLPAPGDDLAIYVSLRQTMDSIARLLLLPSLGLTLVSGLFSMAAVPAYHNAGWAWAKLATAILTFEGTLLAIQGPLEKEAALSEQVLAGVEPISVLALDVSAEVNSLWVLAAVATVNVALGIWRPKFGRRRNSSEPASVTGS